jgi:hypothetical protein
MPSALRPAYPRPPREPAVAQRLLRIDRIDRGLRARWVASDFADAVLERELDELSRAAAGWLARVIERHGWPGRSLVGRSAADAAARLVQHLDGQVAFRQRCLRLARAAARRGDLPWRHVAYLTDALRVDLGRTQLYGTKFQRTASGDLEPLRIERPATVDVRRAALGMEPLASYARRVRRTFSRRRP